MKKAILIVMLFFFLAMAGIGVNGVLTGLANFKAKIVQAQSVE